MELVKPQLLAQLGTVITPRSCSASHSCTVGCGFCPGGGGTSGEISTLHRPLRQRLAGSYRDD